MSPKVDATKELWMQLVCLQFEAFCLQLSFFAYDCVWELLTIGAFPFLLTGGASYFQFETFVLAVGKCVQATKSTKEDEI